MNSRTIALLLIICLSGFNSYSCTQEDNELLINDLNEIIAKVEQKETFSGAVMITLNDNLIYQKVLGFQDLDKTLTNKIDTRFNVGSMNKMHTAVSILQLVQQGKLKLNDKLINIFPNYPNKDVASKVTIHHLLTHSAGMGNYLMKTMRAPGDKYVEVSDYLPLIVNDTLRFTPGERFEYSNSGFMMLGAVIEEISGMSYSDYVEENIYKPAGMTNTGFELYTKSSMENLAKPLTRWSPRSNGKLITRLKSGKGSPAGGGYSTVEDWQKFGKALRSFSLLDEKHYKLLTESKISRTVSVNYAYGFRNYDIGNIKALGHGGGGPGINGEFEYFSNGYAISVLGNLDPPASTWIKRAFISLLLKHKNLLPEPSLKGNTRFELEGYNDAKVVSLSGSFNDSDPYVTILKKEGNKWVCSIDLEPGEYAYSFVVDGQTLLDPKNPETTGQGPMRTFSKLVVK